MLATPAPPAVRLPHHHTSATQPQWQGDAKGSDKDGRGASHERRMDSWAREQTLSSCAFDEGPRASHTATSSKVGICSGLHARPFPQRFSHMDSHPSCLVRARLIPLRSRRPPLHAFLATTKGEVAISHVIIALHTCKSVAASLCCVCSIAATTGCNVCH